MADEFLVFVCMINYQLASGKYKIKNFNKSKYSGDGDLTESPMFIHTKAYHFEESHIEDNFPSDHCMFHTMILFKMLILSFYQGISTKKANLSEIHVKPNPSYCFKHQIVAKLIAHL